MFKLLLLALGFAQLAFCGVYTWDITWVNAAPDGFNRPVIGINGKWPPPTIEARTGERIIVLVRNKLGNETTTIHWHGIRQFGSATMDGPSAVTQCQIQPGGLFTYNFVVENPGTYWYHSHHGSQYPDGLRGVLLVKDRNPPWGDVEEDYTITLSDWYHEQVPALLSRYQSTSNPTGLEPIPNSVLINDGQAAVYPVKAGKKYIFRILNIGAFPSFFFNIKDHDFQIVEMDGVYTTPYTAKTLYIGAAQRYTILVTAKTNVSSNFDIAALVDTNFFRDPSLFTGNPVVHANLQYDRSQPAPVLRTRADLLPAILPQVDDLQVLPLDNQPLLGPVTKQITINFDATLINGIPRHRINNVTYLPQKVPSLYTALSVPKQYALDPRVYGVNSNPYAVNYGDVVEVVINNFTPGGHPWHLHGHQFQSVARSNGGVLQQGIRYTGANLPPVPMRRDTVGVAPGGYVVIRFKADNPGVQLLHCHIEWHVASGLTATIIEATDQLNLQVPLDHKLVCRAQNIPTEGNAAGNTRNVLDLTGANTQVQQSDTGAIYSARRRARGLVSSFE